MRVNKLSISVVLALLWACVTEPPQTLLQPRVESLKGEAGCDYISLEAVLENAENITSAGFYLWADNNEKQRKECLPNGNRIAASFTGLTPATSYQYAAFIANGKDEILSYCRRIFIIDLLCRLCSDRFFSLYSFFPVLTMPEHLSAKASSRENQRYATANIKVKEKEIQDSVTGSAPRIRAASNTPSVCRSVYSSSRDCTHDEASFLFARVSHD